MQGVGLWFVCMFVLHQARTSLTAASVMLGIFWIAQEGACLNPYARNALDPPAVPGQVTGVAIPITSLTVMLPANSN